MKQQTLSIHTQGRGSYEITDKVDAVVSAAQVQTGLCHVFIQHTSASLMLCENADPTVRRDLDAFMARLVPDGDAIFRHTTEGEDDMPAHVRTVLTHSSVTLPITNGRCGLGTWQGVYVWEHRAHPHHRKVTVTVQG
jgi:secondary thiamine-phosphate synthase enzyme